MLIDKDEVMRRLRAYVATYVSEYECADALGVSPSTVNRALNGRTAVPTKLLHELGLEPVTMYRESTK
jgi:DNA-binding transcriptional regulator YdaS (Cro superfamily)